MSADAQGSRSDFKSASTTLRETAKWLAAAFAGAVALVIGGSPFTGFGKLPPFELRWTLALLLLLFGVACIYFALWRTLRILKPDALYRSDLLGTNDEPLSEEEREKPEKREEREELEALRQVIDAHGADLLPDEAPTLGDLATALDDIRENLKFYESNGPAHEIEEGEQRQDKYRAIIADLLPFAQYLRLQRRFEKEQPRMAVSTFLALLSLLGFALAANVPDAPVTHPIHIHNECPGPCDPKPPPVALPSLPAVLFAPGQATLTDSGLQAIQTARDAMEKHPRTLLLVQAHTDTTAPLKLNTSLAQRRALVVLPLLSSQGGIAPNRLLVSYLPETALPNVTPDQKPDAQNRSVRLLMIEDTRR